MYSFNSVVCLFVFLSVNIFAENAKKLEVSVYYETLCGDSVNFFRRQLKPSYEILKDHINISFVPYGKAFHTKDKSGKLNFQCHHGYWECYANKYHACVLNSKLTQEEHLEFVACSIGYYREAQLKECSADVNLSFDLLKSCAGGITGSELLEMYGNRTLNLTPNLSFVPTIIFDGKFDQDATDSSLHDFLYTACSRLSDKPARCPAQRKPKQNRYWIF